MSIESAAPRTERPREHGSPAQRDWLERLTGVGSSKPTFYAEWRRKSRSLDRAIGALRAISVALAREAGGPRSLVSATAGAIGAHLHAERVTIAIANPRRFAEDMPPLVVWPGEEDGGRPSERLQAAGPAPVLAAGPQIETDGAEGPPVASAPLLLGREALGWLLVHLSREAPIDDSDLVIVEALAHQAAVALENARLHQEGERLRARLAAALDEAGGHARALQRRNRELQIGRQRLAEARQRQLIVLERNRIARELHDSVAQHLVSIGMNLEWCRRQRSASAAVHQRLSTSKELARAALRDIRAAIRGLSSLDGQPGLREALRDLGARIGSLGEVEVEVRIRGRTRDLPLEYEHALLCISQEAMFNVLRHADARRARLDLAYRSRRLTLTVDDDGHGDARQVQRLLGEARGGRAATRHRGLANMQHRARELGGTVRIAAREPGIRVVVSVPIPEEGDGRGR
jgi:signal transduction histidine kinase